VTSIEPDETRHAATTLPGIPTDSEGVVFGEPWEAQAFAITLALHERGLFTWPEWAAALAAEIKAAQEHGDPDTGESYYHHWLGALERLVITKRSTDEATLARYGTPGSTPPTARRTEHRSSSLRATSARASRRAGRCAPTLPGRNNRGVSQPARPPD
jgi:nitrile hydratase accessory protein